MVYNDIDESVFYFTYNKLRFYFSSLLYKEKFTRQYKQFLKEEMMKLRIKYKANIYADEMILLLLYKQIEKRGFKVLYDNKRISENYYFTIELDELSIEE